MDNLNDVLEFLEFLPAPVKWLDILTALICGGIIGFERRARGKPAGIRTLTLVCLGTCIFIRLGAQTAGDHTDDSRVLGQVITGIGFLGAGLMLARDGGQITGITSATVVWILAAIGAMIGFDRHAAAILMTCVVIGVLSGTEVIERLIRHPRKGMEDAFKKNDSD